MTSLRLIVSLSAVVFCGLSQDVHHEVAPGEDFSKYKTYRWVDIGAADRASPLLEDALKLSVDTQLTLKGFQKTDSDSADLFVAYQVSIKEDKELTYYKTGWGFGLGGPVSGVGSTAPTGTATTIRVGEVALDFYDSANKRLVWRGTATKTVDAKAKPEAQKKHMNKAMTKLLSKFPPPVQ